MWEKHYSGRLRVSYVNTLTRCAPSCRLPPEPGPWVSPWESRSAQRRPTWKEGRVREPGNTISVEPKDKTKMADSYVEICHIRTDENWIEIYFSMKKEDKTKRRKRVLVRGHPPTDVTDTEVNE